MRKLLYKEFRLALHPTCLIFLTLSAMLLIPNYPYYVTFFYTCLGIFFVCLTGRENQDMLYMLLLPVRKRDVVRARIAMAAALELLQAAAAVPFMILRSLIPTGNQVGMDANLAFLGLAFPMLGLFNFAFFTRYYRDPSQIGKPFAIGSAVLFAYIAVMETLTHIIPFFRNVLDTRDPLHLPQKLAVLALGLALWGLLTLAACHRAERSFERIDL